MHSENKQMTQEINDKFEYEYMPMIHNIVQENIEKFSSSLSFLSDFDEEKFTIKRFDDKKELTKFISFEAYDSNILKVYFCFFDEKLKMFIDFLIFEVNDFFDEDEIKLIREEESFYSSSMNNKILKEVLNRVNSHTVYGNNEFLKFLENESLSILQKRLKNFLNSKL